MKVWPGSPYPLGATYDGSGTNFSFFSSIAEAVELCLFDDADSEPVRRFFIDNALWAKTG